MFLELNWMDSCMIYHIILISLGGLSQTDSASSPDLASTFTNKAADMYHGQILSTVLYLIFEIIDPIYAAANANFAKQDLRVCELRDVTCN